MMYFTYVLKSKLDGNLYIGFTEDLRNRYKEHQGGLVLSTKGRRPLDLIYFEACLSKEKALKREKYFKTGFGKRYLKDRV